MEVRPEKLSPRVLFNIAILILLPISKCLSMIFRFMRVMAIWLCRTISGDPPPRPPQPADYGVAGGAGGSMASSSFGGGRGGYGTGADTTDDESEEIFHKAPTPSQGPIMVS